MILNVKIIPKSNCVEITIGTSWLNFFLQTFLCTYKLQGSTIYVKMMPCIIFHVFHLICILRVFPQWTLICTLMCHMGSAFSCAKAPPFAQTPTPLHCLLMKKRLRAPRWDLLTVGQAPWLCCQMHGVLGIGPHKEYETPEGRAQGSSRSSATL